MKYTIVEPLEYLVENDYYLINGKRYWRVTRVKSVINQPGLTNWMAYVGKKKAMEIMRTRATFGTKVHKLFEIILSGHAVNADNYKDAELLEDLVLFNKFIIDCNVKSSSLEQHLWNDELGVAGTADYFGNYKSDKNYLKRGVEPKFVEDSNVVLDWKTSKSIYKDYWLQLAIYVYMFEKLTDIKLDGAAIVQIRDNKLNIEEKTYDELMPLVEVFKHCIKLFEYTKED